MNVSTGSYTASYMIAMDDSVTTQKEVTAIEKVHDDNTVDALTPAQSLSIVIAFIAVIIFLVCILPFFDN